MTQTLASPINGWKLNQENFDHTILVFRERQAGVGLVYDPDQNRFTYNAYCVETKLMKELFSIEFDFLEDALARINDEFGNWEKTDLSAKSGCGSCVAKGAH